MPVPTQRWTNSPSSSGVLSGHTEEIQQIESQLKSIRKDLVEAGLKRKRVKESTRLAEP